MGWGVGWGSCGGGGGLGFDRLGGHPHLPVASLLLQGDRWCLGCKQSISKGLTEKYQQARTHLWGEEPCCLCSFVNVLSAFEHLNCSPGCSPTRPKAERSIERKRPTMQGAHDFANIWDPAIRSLRGRLGALHRDDGSVPWGSKRVCD